MAHICWAPLEQHILSESSWASETLPNTLYKMPRRACHHWRRLLAPIDTSGALNEGVLQTGCR